MVRPAMVFLTCSRYRFTPSRWLVPASAVVPVSGASTPILMGPPAAADAAAAGLLAASAGLADVAGWLAAAAGLLAAGLAAGLLETAGEEPGAAAPPHAVRAKTRAVTENQ